MNAAVVIATRYFALTLALVFGVLTAGVTEPASAQSPGQPPGAAGPPTWARTPGASEPAPEWMAWRVFYSSMTRMEIRTPSRAQQVIKDRTRMTDNQTASALALGNSYLAKLEAHDQSIRAEVESRFALPEHLQRMLPNPGNLPVPPGRTREDVAAVIGPGLTLSASPSEIREALIKDGSMARIEREKGQILADHKQALKTSIGYESLQSLERWISADIAPRIRRSTDIDRSDPPAGGVGTAAGPRP
jgi:hypothetical protein